LTYEEINVTQLSTVVQGYKTISTTSHLLLVKKIDMFHWLPLLFPNIQFTATWIVQTNSPRINTTYVLNWLYWHLKQFHYDQCSQCITQNGRAVHSLLATRHLNCTHYLIQVQMETFQVRI